MIIQSKIHARSYPYLRCPSAAANAAAVGLDCGFSDRPKSSKVRIWGILSNMLGDADISILNCCHAVFPIACQSAPSRRRES